MAAFKQKLFAFYLGVMKWGCKLIPTKPNTVTILNGAGLSGSNAMSFYQYLKTEHPELTVNLISGFPSAHLAFSTWRQIAQAKVLVGTHWPFKIHRGQRFVQLWHGIPLKRMGYLALNEDPAAQEKSHRYWWRNVDYLASSGPLYDTLMSACQGLAAHQFLHTGFPRNDEFQLPEATLKERQATLAGLFADGVVTDQTKIFFYLPTFRMEDGATELSVQLKTGNIFGLSDFAMAAFEQQLADNNIVILAKLHPVEERQVDPAKFATAHRLKVLTNDWFIDQHTELYQFLAATDGLITDYSSVYLDYLLLDRPIVFNVPDLAHYEQTRGFLLAPYDDYTPGPKTTTTAELVQALTRDRQADAPLRAKLRGQMYPQGLNPACPQVYDQIKGWL